MRPSHSLRSVLSLLALSALAMVATAYLSRSSAAPPAVPDRHDAPVPLDEAVERTLAAGTARLDADLTTRGSTMHLTGVTSLTSDDGDLTFEVAGEGRLGTVGVRTVAGRNWIRVDERWVDAGAGPGFGDLPSGWGDYIAGWRPRARRPTYPAGPPSMAPRPRSGSTPAAASPGSSSRSTAIASTSASPTSAWPSTSRCRRRRSVRLVERATIDLSEPRERLPIALADLHGAMSVGAPLDLQVVHGDHEGPGLPGDDLDGARYFAAWSAPALSDVVTGAGFTVESIEVEGDVVRLRATRARTLADTVGPGMRLLVCGLNPSIYSADRGVGYARPGNRFWKAVVAAGLVAAERALRPAEVLHADGIGITDLCKRATVASRELSPGEYRDGAARVERLVCWLRPGAVVFVGLEGWRTAVDRHAVPGVQPQPFGGRPAYVLPSTSGLNAHSRLEDLVRHFLEAARLSEP